MNEKKIKLFIDLKNIKDAEDIMRIFTEKFDLWDWHEGKKYVMSNWDAFRDNFRCLDIKELNKKNILNVVGVCLILENYKALDNIDPKDKKIFEEILEEMTHKENRYDDLDFSYEIRN